MMVYVVTLNNPDFSGQLQRRVDSVHANRASAEIRAGQLTKLNPYGLASVDSFTVQDLTPDSDTVIRQNLSNFISVF